MTASIRGRIAESLHTFREVLRNRNLRRLEAAWAVALTSGWAYSIAIVVYTFDVGGPGLVGVALAIKLVPAAIASAPLATLADRHSKKRVLVGAQVGLALSTVGVAALIAAGGPVALVIATNCVLGIFQTVLQPAVSATLPSLCERPEELTAANVVNSTIESLSIFVGPAIGGLVIGLASSATLAGITAVGFLVSALLTTLLPEDAPSASPEGEAADDESPPGFLASVAGGFRVVGRDPGLRLIVGLMAAQTFVDGAMGVLTAVAAIELLDSGDAGIGYLNSAVGVGALCGSLVAAGMVGRRLAPGFAAGLILWGVPIALIGLLTENFAALILFGIVGVGNILIDVAGLTMLQRAAPEEMIARVFGVLETLTLAAVAAGSLVTPLLLEIVGNEATFLIIGALLPALAALTWRQLRALDRARPAPTAALQILSRLPFFAPLEPEALESVAARAEAITTRAGETVVSQGEPGDRFYVIVSGELEVLIDGRRARAEGPGDYFGEIALLREVPRTATVIALSDSELLSVDGDDFVGAVSGHAVGRRRLDAIATARLAHMRPALAIH
ncbi:MAG: MFS transporter [Solirubrobacterales bacterium]